jgi:drug/metabolite transporter (DMT)-like permease
MGRFEQRPDNSRIRGDISRAAENALWDVVDELENLQRNLLRSLQDDVKRLESEKKHLVADIQQLIVEKEQLQQTKQISEQQVLIRQLAEVLAKHISSQLQSSLKTLANQAVESESFANAIKLKSVQMNPPAGSEVGENVSRVLDSLDDTITIALTSLQQELKNYQSNLSQQLSRMYNQQQQGEAILAKFVSHLQQELDKVKETTPVKAVMGGTPTLLQLNQSQNNGSVEKFVPEPINQSISSASPEKNQHEAKKIAPLAVLPASGESTISPDSNVSLDLSKQPALTEKEIPSANSTNKPISVEPISVLNQDLSLTPTPEELSSTESVTQPVSVPGNNLSENPTENSTEPPSVMSKVAQEVAPKIQGTKNYSKTTSMQLGFFLVALSAVMSSLYNIAIKGIFDRDAKILGGLEPTLSNIFLVSLLRLLIVVPLMVLSAPILYPQIWQDLQNLFNRNLFNPISKGASANQPKTKQVLLFAFLSGCFLFLSQTLIYIAISQIKTGIATTLLFIYPIISVLVCWILFRDRPTSSVIWAIATIFCGEILILGSDDPTMINGSSMGIIAGISSGIAFAVYIILTRLCAQKIYPVTLTLINFITMLFLSFISLIVSLLANGNLTVNSTNFLEVILSTFILGVLTLCSYLFNNLGIRQVGGLRVATIGSFVPILTVIFAGLTLQETLDIGQIMGVLLVSFGAGTISFIKMLSVN